MANRGSDTAHVIKGNDWSPLVPPALAQWRPSLRVAVVVAGEPDQERLNLTLAALGRQTYPAELLDVVVIDNGPQPVLKLGRLRPDRARIVTAAGGGAFDAAVAATDAQVIIRVEAGVVAGPEFVAALARWQHVTADAVSIAPPRLVTGWATPDEVADHADAMEQLFPPSAGTPRAELTELLDASNQLRAADHLGFLAVAGAPFAFHRERCARATDAHQGADIEVGYRLAQAGAVFIPEPQAAAWLLGPARDEARAARHRRAELADLMPYPRDNRPAAARAWSVPLVTAVVRADGRYELVRACVDRLLANDETDLRVLLVGDWRTAGAGSGDEDLCLVAAEYRSEARVRLVDAAPATGYPSPYLLRVPSHLGVGVTTVRALVAAAERWQVGLIRVLPAGAGSPAQSVELWRTDALSRALRTAGVAQQLAAVARSHGQRWETGSEYGVVDLSELPATELRSPAPRLAEGPAIRPEAARRPRSGRSVEVGGARSLAKATLFVTRRYARAARRRLIRR